MQWLTGAIAGLALALCATPAAAQLGSDGEKFVDAIREGDTAEALSLLQAKPIIIDTIDARGDTALVVALRRRDSTWAGHLLREGADPNLAGRGMDPPLVAATRVGFTEAVGWLLAAGARVDGANRKGETALIVAVQEKRAPLVRLLLSAGADPDRADSAAGLSARDYAKRETRYPELLTAIEQSRRGRPPAKPASGKLDDFKLN